MTFALFLVAAFILTGLMVAGLNRLAIQPWRRTSGQHWAERARVLWPTRVSAGLQIMILPFVALCIMTLFFPLRAAQVPLVLLSSWAGAIFGTWPFDREIFPDVTFKSWLGNAGLSWILRFGIWLVWVCAIWIMPLEVGWGMLAVVLGVMVAQIIWGQLVMAVLRLAGTLQPPDERLNRVVADVSQRSGIPVRRTWIARDCCLNAFAFPLRGDLIFTDRLLKEMTDAELSAICAHEIGHLGEPWKVKMARFVASWPLLPLLYLRHIVEFGEPVGVILLLLGTSVLYRIGAVISRRMEHRADDIAKLAEAEPGVYARALEKIYMGNQMPAVMKGGRSIHPNLYDRMVSAGVTPDFPRPLPPEGLSWHTSALLALLGVMVGWMVNRYVTAPMVE